MSEVVVIRNDVLALIRYWEAELARWSSDEPEARSEATYRSGYWRGVLSRLDAQKEAA